MNNNEGDHKKSNNWNSSGATQFSLIIKQALSSLAINNN